MFAILARASEPHDPDRNAVNMGVVSDVSILDRRSGWAPRSSRSIDTRTSPSFDHSRTASLAAGDARLNVTEKNKRGHRRAPM